MRKCLLTALALCVAPVAAQDVGPALNPGLMVGFAGGAAVHYDNQRRSAAPRASVRTPLASALRAGPVPASAAADAPFNFASTAASRQDAARSYLERLRRSDEGAAKALDEQMRKNNLSVVYANIVRSFGLSNDDAADALTGYTILGYLIATGAADPSRDAVRNVRRQIAGRLGTSADFRTTDMRRRLGEELKISFVALHAGWQAARREGNLKRYSDGVAAMFKANGVDLRALRLTQNGFTGR